MNFRPLLFIAVGFAGGILFFRSVFASDIALPWLTASAIAACLTLIALVFFSIRNRSLAGLLFAAAFILGAARMALALPGEVPAGEHDLRGVVCSVSDSDPRSVMLTRVRIDGTAFRYRVRLRISESCGGLPEVGDGIETVCTVADGLDYRDPSTLNMLSSGTGLKARCDGYELISRNGLPLERLISRVRGMLKRRIDELFPRNAALIAAFLLGDRSGLDYSELESFRITGTAHLLSLSGFHVGVLTGGILCVLPRSKPRLRLLLTGAFLLVFCSLTGSAPSLVRASVMCLCVLLADATEERRDPLSSLSLAAVIILAFSPYSLWSVGFRLSFAATIGIVLFAEQYTSGSRSSLVGKIAEGLLVTFSATVATLLLNARYFGSVSTYTLPVNVAAVPFYSAAIMLSFIVLVIGIPMPFAARYLAVIPDGLLSGVNFCLIKTAGLPYARLAVGSPPDICGFLLLLMLFMLSPYILRTMKKRVIMTLPVMLVFMACVVLGFVL